MRFIALTAMRISRSTAFEQDEVHHHTLIQAVKRPFGTVAQSFGADVAVSTSVKSWSVEDMTSFVFYHVYPPVFGLDFSDFVEEETRKRLERSYTLIPGHLLSIEEIRKSPPMEELYKEVRTEMAILTMPNESAYTILTEMTFSYEGWPSGRFIFKPVQFYPLI